MSCLFVRRSFRPAHKQTTQQPTCSSSSMNCKILSRDVHSDWQRTPDITRFGRTHTRHEISAARKITRVRVTKSGLCRTINGFAQRPAHKQTNQQPTCSSSSMNCKILSLDVHSDWQCTPITTRDVLKPQKPEKSPEIPEFRSAFSELRNDL